MSSTLSKKIKDLPRKLVSKMPFTRSKSRPPSRAPTPVPDHSSVHPTQGGNDEGAPPTNVANAPSEERTETLPEWDGWQVDESSVADLKTWFDQHGDTKWAKFAGEVNRALQSKAFAMLQDHIPDGILPVKSLANGIISLVQLVVKIPGTKRDAYDFASRAIGLINDLVDVFRNTPSSFLEESWEDFKGVRDAVTNICKWANEQLRKPVPNADELGELQKKFDDARGQFQFITTLRIRAEQAAEKQRSEIDKKLAARVAHRVRYEEQNKAFCATNTRVKILEALEQWATELSDGQRIYWITGIPGSGKSTIAATIARRLKEYNVLCAQYFISRNVPDTTDPNRLFPTIAYQLAESPAAARVIHEELRGTSADKLSKEQAMALLLKPIRKAPGSSQTSVIVIDALDELDSPGKDDVPPILFDIASQLPKNVKLIITSRPENRIVTALQDSNRVTLYPDDTREEVASFISSELKAIGERRGWQEWPSTTQIQDLSAKADGLFHYAATAVRWIKQRVENNGKAAKERVFDDVPKLGVGELEKLYDLILKTWLAGDTGEEHSADDPMRATRLKYFPWIIGCIVIRREPLSIRDITSILNIPENEFDIENFFQQMRSVLIPGTDSFTEDDIPQMHKSFRDYIGSRHSPKEFQIDEDEAHMVTAKACLSVVVKIQDSGSAYHYACTQWWRHLELAYKKEPRRDSDITNMLETLQDLSVRAAWYSEIYALDAFIALAKVGWEGMKKFGIDDPHKCLDTTLAQLKEVSRRLTRDA